MNRIHRIVWNRKRHAWMVTSESTRSGSKSSRSPLKRLAPLVRHAGKLTAVLLLAGAENAAAQCAASGGTVSTSTTAGCRITNTDSTLTVTNNAVYTGWVNSTGTGSTVTIDAGASIVGSASVGGNPWPVAVSASGSPATNWSLVNNGTISVPAALGWDAVGRRQPGTTTVVNTGVIRNDTATNMAGIASTGGGITLNVTNSGTIHANGGPAIWTDSSGTNTIVNQSGGLIESLSNSAIYQPGITSATITNEAGATIRTLSTGLRAIYFGNPGTMRNGGTITVAGSPTGQFAVEFSGSNSTLILEPTSSITGLVGGGASNTLALGGNSGTGSFSLNTIGNSQQYRNFTVFDKRENSNWTLTGTNSNQSPLNWTLNGGSLVLGAGATLTGSIVNAAPATSDVSLTIAGTLNHTTATPAITFNGSGNNSLILQTGALFTGVGNTLGIGGGTVTLTGPVAFPNTVTVSGGLLRVGDNAAGTGGAVTGNIVNNAAVAFNRSDAATYAGVISGTGSVAQTGSGTQTLSGSNTYSGGTSLNTGTLAIASDSNLGAASGALTFNGGTLLTTAGLASTRAANMAGNGTIDNGGNTDTFSGLISGPGGLTSTGSGTLILTADNTYAGPTTIAAGVLQVGIGGTTGAVAGGNIVDNGTLVINRSNSLTLSGVISGTGAFTQAGTGTTILTADNTYTGPTTISAGTLQLGNGGASGGLANTAIANNGALVVNRSDTLTLPGVISGTGSFTQAGTGTTILSASNTYTGPTTVAAGKLQVDGSIASPLTTVQNGATLGGSGTLGGSVNIADGGHLAPGASAGTLTIGGDLLLNSGSILDYELGQANTPGGPLNDLTNVSGNLTLDGTLNVTQSAGGTFGPGVYRIIGYGGTLTDNGLAIGPIPGGPFFIQTVVPNQVNLVNTEGAGPLTFWDGGTAANIGNGRIDGGSGIWRATASDASWADGAGNINAPWQAGGFAIFQTAPGTVTVDNGGGQVTFSGAQFAVGGYALNGQTLVTDTANTIVRVGDGTSASAAMTATIGNVIGGTGGLEKTDLGTLVLAADNTYTGDTTISSGTLQLGNGGASGRVAGNIVNNGALVFDRSDTSSVANVISGTGTVTQSGSGTLILAGNNTYSGGTFFNRGVVVMNDESNLGTGGLAFIDGTLRLTRDIQWSRPTTLSGAGVIDNGGRTGVFEGPISGTGGLTVTGSGRLVLRGDLTYTGTTTIDAGTLQLGDPSVATGNLPAGNIVNNALLQVATNDNVMFSATISGTGTFEKVGNGTVILSGSNTYSGGTRISDGVLSIASDGNLGAPGGAITFGQITFSPGILLTTAGITSSRPVDLQFDGVLDNGGNANTFTGVFSGPGHLVSRGTGTLTLTGNNTYGGGTTIDGGVLAIGSDNNLGASSGALSIRDGVLRLTADVTSARAMQLLPLNGTIDNGGHIGVFSGVIDGAGSLTATGAGTLTLSGVNTYSGGTAINAGTLSIGADANLGDANGALTFNGGTLLTTADVTSARAINLAANGTIDNGGNTDTLSGVIAGAGGLTSLGSGTLILTGDNTYTGPTTISAGTLQLGNGGTSGGVVDTAITDNGALVVNRSDTLTLPGVISGTGSLTQAGTGTTIFTADNTYTGPTTISAGTLQLGNGGTSGSVANTTIANDGALVVNRNNTVTLPGVISGTGSFTQAGTGTTILSGNNTYAGTTTVAAGRLQVDGTSGSGATTVLNTGTLSGNGTVGGAVTIQDGGHLAPGTSPGTLTIAGDLALNPGAILDYEFGQANTVGGPLNDLTVVNGNLTLDGTLNVTQSAGGAFGPGVYRIIGYSGTFTDNGLALGSTPAPGSLIVQTAVANQVNLVNTQGLSSLTFWDGSVAANFNNSSINGGNGTWRMTGSDASWADSTGSVNAAWQADGFAIFQATPGTVTVDNSAGQVSFSGAQFAVNGYTISGQPLLTNTANTILRVGDGTSAGTGMTATIASVIDGTGGIEKTDLGTLVLSGANTFTGGTTISAGTLSIGADTNLGAASGALTFNGGTLLTTADVTSARAINLAANGTIDNGGNTDTLSGVIAGAGGLTSIGSGTLILTGNNTYTGPTTISAGTLQLGDGGTSGGVVDAAITDNGALVVNRSDALTLPGVISGTGSFTQAGTGTTIFTADNTYTGPTTISAGTLQLGNGGTSGSVTGNIVNNAALIFNRGDTPSYAGIISGSGSVAQSGAGTLTLSGVNTYSGGTTVNAGTLSIGADANLGAASGALTFNGGTLLTTADVTSARAINLAANGTIDNGGNTDTLSGVIAGAGGLTSLGSGTLILTGNNTYTGPTTISAGTLQLGDGGTSGSVVDTAITDNGALVINRSDTLTLPGVISGTGSFTQAGTGTTIFTADNTYTGPTTISAGTLQLGNGGTSGSVVDAAIANNGALVVNRSSTVTLPAAISGTGSFTQAGTGTTIFTADNTYTGPTTISAGTLQLGNGGTTGSLANTAITNGGALVVNRSNTVTLPGIISGTGSFTQAGTGTTILTGNNTYSGTTTVAAGRLQVDGTSGSGATNVLNTGTLSGNGTVGGAVTILDGGHLAPGASPGTLTIAGDLLLNPGAILDYEFGQANTVGGPLNDLTVVNGNLTLDGTLNVTQSAGGAFGPGVYRIIGYSGTLTDNGLALGSTPAPGSLIVQTAVANQVNLVNTQGLSSLTFWDGSVAANFNNSSINGGNGTWRMTGSDASWADSTGAINAAWQAGGFAIFQATPGTVTVDNSAGQVSFSGAQFAVNGYTINGQPLLTNTANTILRVGDGTSAGTGMTATIASVIDGTGGIEKADLGTLVLSGANTFTGGTTISAGTLSIGADTNLGAASGALTFNGGTLLTTADVTSARAINLAANGTIDNSGNTDTLSGVIAGAGGLTSLGSGTLVLTGNNTYTGPTTISAGTLQLGNGGTSGSVTGNIVNNAALIFDRGDTSTYGGVISGSGSFTQAGTGTTLFTADNTYTGPTTISAGTLQLGNGGTSGSVANTAIANNGALVVNRSNTVTLPGVISGTGSFTQAGTGTTVLTGNNTYAGDTTISAGILQFGDGGTSGSVTGNIVNNAALIFNRGDTPSYAGIISGSGSVAQSGTGTLTLSGVNTYSGGTAINAGTLSIGADANLGAATGALTFNGGTLLTTADVTSARAINLAANGIIDNGGNTDTLSGVIAGAGGLTSLGSGTLILTGDNTYTGPTTISAGTLQLGNGGTSGSVAGNIVNNAALIFDRNDTSTYAGLISGSGSVTQAGTGTLTLDAANTYAGGTQITAGTLIAPRGDVMGTGAITNNAALRLDFASDSTLGNALTGTGLLDKTGAGIAMLTAANSATGNVMVDAGTLRLAQDTRLDVSDSFTTAAGATTRLDSSATIGVANAFTMNGVLDDIAGRTQPVVSAGSATIAPNASFNLSGYSAPVTATASELAFNLYTEIRTTGGLSGTFSTVSLGGSTSPVDYLTLTSFYTPTAYNIGLALTWYAGHTVTPADANGVFTLTNASDSFNLDIVLADEAANPAKAWDGKTLTKAGAGTLQLSKANLYTGATLVNSGTLRAGASNVVASSAQVAVASGATFDLNDFNQRVNQLSGAGNVTLGSALLTANNTATSEFGGVISGGGSLEKTGAGTLVLSGNNAYTGTTTISAGTLQLGNGGTSGSVAGDIANQGVLVFQRADDIVYDKVIGGAGDLIQQGSGRLLLPTSQTYAGTTTVNAGSLVLANGAQLLNTREVTVAPGATLGGYGGVGGNVINQGLLAVADAAPGFSNGTAGQFTVGGNLINSGEIRMASPSPTSTLTVAGNYTGNNGRLTLSTVLAGDDSATDRLVVHGDTAGQTAVTVNNAGGTGAQTTQGIRLIQVDGQSNGLFALNGRLVAGAYEYSLFKGGVSTPDDGDWYLRSLSLTPTPVPSPVPRPETGAYLGNQAAAYGMFVHTLYDRAGLPGSTDAGGKHAAWVRAAGGHTSSDAAGGLVSQSTNTALVHAGIDLLERNVGTQRWQAGLMAAFGTAHTHANSSGNPSPARGSVDGVSVGAYGTWHGNTEGPDGPYLDSWLQYAHYDNTVKGQNLNSESYGSNLWSGSIEGGWAFPIGQAGGGPLVLTPQAQLIYTSLHTGDRQESNGTVVRSEDGSGWATRLGVRLSRGAQSATAPGWQPYLEVNWWHNTVRQAMAFDNTVIAQDGPKNNVEVKAGVQAELARHWKFWGHVAAQSGSGGYQGIGGLLGVRYSW